MSDFFDYLNEVTLSRVWQHVENRPLGIVTAFRGEYDRKENVTRNRKLAADIRDGGFGFFVVQGSYIEKKGTPEERRVREDSFFVTTRPENEGNLLGALRKWCRDYEQESVLWKPLSSDVAFGVGQDGSMTSLGVFHPNRVSDYMSRLRGSPGSFVFEQAGSPMNWLERQRKDKLNSGEPVHDE